MKVFSNVAGRDELVDDPRPKSLPAVIHRDLDFLDVDQRNPVAVFPSDLLAPARVADLGEALAEEAALVEQREPKLHALVCGFLRGSAPWIATLDPKRTG